MYALLMLSMTVVMEVVVVNGNSHGWFYFLRYEILVLRQRKNSRKKKTFVCETRNVPELVGASKRVSGGS